MWWRRTSGALERLDLIVIGTHGRRGVKGILLLAAMLSLSFRAAPVPAFLVRVPEVEGTPEVDAGQPLILYLGFLLRRPARRS